MRFQVEVHRKSVRPVNEVRWKLPETFFSLDLAFLWLFLLQATKVNFISVFVVLISNKCLLPGNHFTPIIVTW